MTGLVAVSGYKSFMLQRIVSSNGVTFYASPLLTELGVRHAFSTRLGGVSAAPFDSLNLGNPNGCDIQDESEHIRANYARLHETIGCGDQERCYVHQIHGRQIVDVCRGQPFDMNMKADALAGDDPTRMLAIRVADCVPVLLAGNDGKIVAALHAGWRGVVAGIIPAAIEHLKHRGASSALFAAIGPCIGFDAFEVGPEVLGEFERCFGLTAPIRRVPSGKGFVDLRAAVRLQLLANGLSEDAIDATDRCTHAHAEEFFSHRRDKGVTGRMAALISPRG